MPSGKFKLESIHVGGTGALAIDRVEEALKVDFVLFTRDRRPGLESVDKAAVGSGTILQVLDRVYYCVRAEGDFLGVRVVADFALIMTHDAMKLRKIRYCGALCSEAAIVSERNRAEYLCEPKIIAL